MAIEWVIYTIIATAIWAVLNIVDSYLMNTVVKNTLTVTVLWGVFQTIAIIPLFFLLKPILPSTEILFILILGGIFYLGCLWFYFKALQQDDTSNIIALWNLGSIMIPIFAFFLLNERLGINQYIAIALIVFSSAAISIKDAKNLFKPSTALVLMIFASLIISFAYITEKYAIDSGASV
ncbi:MAG: EamA family transporter, partial [Candidatus Diapherotrites archaeon]|nr:EamA family transporter [Candidatus Diapherotrites archaeon]